MFWKWRVPHGASRRHSEDHVHEQQLDALHHKANRRWGPYPRSLGRWPTFDAPRPPDLLRALHEEAGGVLFGALIRRGRVPVGSAEKAAVRRWHTYNASQRLLCLGCEHVFTAPEEARALWWFSAFVESPSIVSVTGVCGSCARMTDAELEAAGLKLMRSAWPDLRRLDRALMAGKAGTA